MTDTLLNRMPVEQMPEGTRAAWNALHDLSGDATFVEVFANAPELLDFAMVKF